MEGTNRFWNISLMLLGIVVAVLSMVAFLLGHRYVYYGEVWSEGIGWRSTIGLLLMGVWLFILGLVGLIRKKRIKHPKEDRS
jgi:hypothetical protein